MDFKEALDALVEEIKALVQRLIDKAPFDKTYTGVVVVGADPSNNYTATVTIAGKDYKIRSDHNDPVGSYVRVKVPKNDWTQAFVLGSITAAYISTKGTLPSGDLNDATTVGMYALSGGNTYTHAPTGLVHGVLEVIRGGQTSAFVIQVIYPTANDTSPKERTRVNGTWSAWQSMGGTPARDASTLVTNVTLERNGRVRVLHVTNASLTSAQRAALIPEADCPLVSVRTAGAIFSSNTYSLVVLVIHPYSQGNGALMVYNTSGSTIAAPSNLSFTLTWVV